MKKLGAIKLWRQLSKAPFYQNSLIVHMWIHLLISAQYNGRIFTDFEQLEKQTGLVQENVQSCLEYLHNINFITITGDPDKKIFQIDIPDFNLYKLDSGAADTSEENHDNDQ
ncbi:hypothetical protein NO1_0250 [Candidatus Termititenax aidoneus]|uniref:Uncharacterized protein n=1 Tax=Termititenax aidoneus TaxID=2218524 RepID=A0A388T9L8_TERA1|nr:hypothetical protein NO1_0250 [Candidatus Termititenax aidoneus]